MKRTLTLIIICAWAVQAGAQTFSDNFDGYTTGALGPQSTTWTTWSGTEGGAEDAQVVTNQAHSGAQSIYFSTTVANGGPQDVILPLGGQYSSGKVELGMWVYVESGKGAYFNVQATSTPGTEWAMDCYMNPDGSLKFQDNQGNVVAQGTFSQGAWFELELSMNITTNTWEAWVNGTSIGTFQSTSTSVASIDIYPVSSNNSAGYWIDDVTYTYTPYILPTLNLGVTSLNIPNGLAGTQQPASAVVKNIGQNTINSFDIQLDYNGTQQTKNVTGVTIGSMANYTVNFDNPVTLASGSMNATATSSNVNGLGPDGDNTDDVKTLSLNPVVPAPGKVVVGEEGTGTWCGWCPRGAVVLATMDQKYGDNFIGIAVHNGDPMVVAHYDSSVSAAIAGYPSGFVDRGSEVDPLGFEGQFLQRILEAPSGLLLNRATYNSGTNELTVSVKTNIVQATTGNYKLSCVLTEDNVTGTGAGYNQTNYYAGGGNGVMGGYELLTNPVPAANMVYQHVARAISPSFTGIDNAFTSATSVGDTFAHTFTFTLDAAWEYSEMHIVSLFLAPDGSINNASKATIDEAIANWTVSALHENMSAENLLVWPNPSQQFINVSHPSFGKEGGTLHITNLLGEEVMTVNPATEQYRLSVANLANGIYVLRAGAAQQRVVVQH